jgi:hypothetical protein
MHDNTFELSGRSFSLNKIDAFRQFHIVRRIGPILTDLLPVLKAIASQDTDKMSDGEQLDATIKLATPLMQGLAKLSDADAEYVFQNLLNSVQVKQMPQGNWARVFNNGMLMMNDLELPILFQIAGRALMHNLSGFFAALPQK